MASSFQGWGNSWALTWERISNPNAMYGSATIRFAASGELSGQFIGGPPGSMVGSASISISTTGDLTTTGVPSTGGASPMVVGGRRRRSDTRQNQERRNYNLTRLHDDDQVVTELLVSLVTGGFFNGNK